MKKNDANTERLKHVLQAIKLIRLFVGEIKLEGFLENRQIQSAVLYQFLIIGEAVKNIDQSLLNKYTYPWHMPRSFRNFIAHEYHNLNIRRVYEAIAELDDLKVVVEQIIDKETHN
ncbi:MAG: DUF86 domain-containing protein [Bacteroidetes bacterium]|jgi:uncharacterized protein with HEPN domain|nr:DUF86 domain-containing protein [Bacteroidota bacterium]MBT5529048.1 DUF86 domain-containing protein [Cytophagia bacterium]MBT3421259.1 DUF86 domain-containing protein [Bacteroidota bacterium]MBT3802755.1 DUF86 domain-containing protein [Bacteroidota bacterium]MBT3935625.1 DUF86 domain-containing protein [Bacteroidota bacterium]